MDSAYRALVMGCVGEAIQMYGSMMLDRAGLRIEATQCLTKPQSAEVLASRDGLDRPSLAKDRK